MTTQQAERIIALLERIERALQHRAIPRHLRHTCRICHTVFVGRVDARYCSSRCRQAQFRVRRAG